MSTLTLPYPRFIHLLLLASERAWAQAMHTKSTHSADGAKIITGSAKKHIGSRLHRASVYAEHLVTLLKKQATSKANTEATLEARAYHVSLLGATQFEKKSWDRCLRSFSESHLIYSALARSRGSKEEDLFRDLLNTTIDPSIRYAAYQQKIPRTTSIDTIVARFISSMNKEFVQDVLKQNSEALGDSANDYKKTPSSSFKDVPTTIEWRSRRVNLEDAATAQALAAVSTAKDNLLSFLSSNLDANPQAKGAAYDEVLLPSQDAVDATKTAIDELAAEGISQSDRRMQSLQITKTAVNYALVGWRVGRNRILCGELDGAILETAPSKQQVKPSKDGKPGLPQAESNSRKLTRLKERLVLYDSTLQSLDSVKDLPGVATDEQFLEGLEARRSYFAALRCLTIAHSHSVLQQTRKALALLSRALEMISSASQNISSSEERSEGALNLDVTPAQAETLQRLLEGMVFQHRALVVLHDLDVAEAKQVGVGREAPLVERLKEYPRRKVDLTNLVTYPPRVEAIPVKPLFLDVAFSYIGYPGQTRSSAEKAVNGLSDGQASRAEKKEAKKGWFGFGR